MQPPEFPRLSPELERAIFRIIQEALTNVFRHSGAQRGWISVVQRESEVVVKVRDDGKGITEQVSELQPDKIGVGIGGMSQRAKEFGENCEFQTLIPARSSRSSSPVAISCCSSRYCPSEAGSCQPSRTIAVRLSSFP